MPSLNPNYEEFPLTFEKGLVTEVEDSVLETGQAAELLNWEPSAGGGLRTRNSWQTLSKTGLTAPYNVRGFGSIAAGGSSSASLGAQVVQTSRWPDGANVDPVSTKTGTLTGITVGHVLVAIVTDNSGLTPTVTGGWTQRAVSSGNNQFVKFYTKTAASSTEAFTYTISSARIRSLTVYELGNVDQEDPGSNWAAGNHSVGSGSDTLTVNTTDVDGGIALVGYHYDAGTPATSGSGSSGYGGSTLDDSNSRTGVLIEDLDQLDTIKADSAADYITPSWTPPAAGTLLCVWAGQAGTSASLTSVTGNGLTWSTPTAFTGSAATDAMYYSWADLNAGSTTGTLTVNVSMNGAKWFSIHFFHIIGAPDAANPVQQTQHSTAASGNPSAAALGSNLQPASGLIGIAHSRLQQSNAYNPQADADDFDSTTPLDELSVFSTNDGLTHFVKTASKNSAATTDTSPDWTNNTGGSLSIGVMEILGNGGAAHARHGTFPTLGAVTEGYSYVGGKNITAKIVTWSANPAAVQSDVVTFYITLAVATGSTTYKIYRILRDQITSGTWELIDSVTDATSNDVWVSFSQGAGKLVWTASSLTAPRAIDLGNLLSTNIGALAGKQGRASVYHKDRMFIGGSTSAPMRLYFSGIAAPTNFTTATDFIDVGGDDGEAINDLISVEGLLLVCKNNRLYLISGSGIESFFVNELPGGSATSGRPAIRTPYGTIVAGPEDVWVVQGGGVDPMSRPLGAGYEPQGNVSTAYAQDSVLISDALTGQQFRVNLVTGAWSKEVVNDNPAHIVFSLKSRMYYGTNGSTTQLGGKRQLSDGRTYDKTADETAYRASTGKTALAGPNMRYTPRYLYLQLRSQSELESPLHLVIRSNIGEEEHYIQVNQEIQREIRSLGKHKGAEWLQVSYDCGANATTGAIDIEKAVLGVIEEKKQ